MRALPPVGGHRPERLVEPLAVLHERPFVWPLAIKAKLLKDTVAPWVGDRGSRLQPVNACRREQEVQHYCGALHEQAGAPITVTKDKPPFGTGAIRRRAPDLNEPDRSMMPVWDYREAVLTAGLLLAMGPRDKISKCFEILRRRENEAGNRLGREKRRQ